ncbi:MAG: rhomboid family intramembrane serine protease [Flavobacteriales bacterium]|nr:MAG: rhomboid family intramembrane serine protease [Flavobacteriales bacterium]
MNNLKDKIRYKYRTANIVEQIIYINIGIYIVSLLFKLISFLFASKVNYLYRWFSLPSPFESFLYKPWTLVTYGFLHADLFHILFNLLILYYMGRLFLDFFSRRDFLIYFFSGIIIGGILYLASYNLFPALQSGRAYLLGASAGVMAILIGLAAKIPNYAIRFRFIGYIKLWYIAVAFVLIDLIQIPISNTGGHIAHLGGALTGYLLTTQFTTASRKNNWLINLFGKKKKSPLKTVYKKRTATQSKSSTGNNQQERIDAILDKISKSGYGSLSQDEKDFLFSVGKK